MSLQFVTGASGAGKSRRLLSEIAERSAAAPERQFIVLDAMVRNGAISESLAESAKIQPLYLAH